MDSKDISERTPMRDKYWSELDVEGKLDRMRQVVLGYEYKIGQLEDHILELRQHSHAGERIVVPLSRESIGRFRSVSKTDNVDDVYF